MNIFIGNLSRQVTDADLREAFEAHGAVASANVIKDKFTGESRGFGFVEMADQAQAQAAIAAFAWAASAISTNPKPRDSPVNLSLITLADATAPWASKASRRSASVTWRERLPMKMFMLCCSSWC